MHGHLTLLRLWSLIFLASRGVSGRFCKVIPTDFEWPSVAIWNQFNRTVDGRLIRTVPLATPCHGQSFNADQCQFVQENWHDAFFHEQSASSIQAAAFANRSCDPFNGPNAPCVNGNYVEYAVNVSTVQHVVTTLNFAQQYNIRFIVKNTGHDYMGKSTGHGGLSIWMHHLTDTQWFAKYNSPLYTGPAVRAEAGVSVNQIYSEASAHGLSVVGGACPTVGYTGGFLQGGGHGPLSTLYGLAADDILSFEVITTIGKLVIASPTENSDLFFALSGGGPGTYGIVWTATVKAHPDVPTSAALLTFSVSNNVTLDAWFQGVNAYRSIAPRITQRGGYGLAVYELGFFQLSPLIVPNGTRQDINEILSPFLGSLGALNIPFTLNVTSYRGYFQAYTNVFNETLFAIANAQVGGRLFLQSSWKNNATLAPVNNLFKNILSAGAGVYDIAVTPKTPSGNAPKNAVFPPWRQTQSTVSIFLPWDDHGDASEAHAQQQTITRTLMPAVKAITPASGAYMNEASSSCADAFDPDWKQTFYGVNYNTLLSIKDKWDPIQMLYGSTAVGGDRWKTLPDGRLCRAI